MNEILLPGSLVTGFVAFNILAMAWNGSQLRKQEEERAKPASGH